MMLAAGRASGLVDWLGWDWRGWLGWAGLADVSLRTFNDSSKLMKMQLETKFTQSVLIPFLRV